MFKRFKWIKPVWYSSAPVGKRLSLWFYWVIDGLVTMWIYFEHAGFLLPVLFIKLPALDYQAQMIAVRARDVFLSDFSKFLSAFAATISTGKSLYGAFEQTIAEFSTECAALEKELRILHRLMQLGTPLTTGLVRMAQRYDLDEAEDLAAHIRYAQDYGHSMSKVLKRSSDWIGGQILHKRRITIQMTEKVLEFRMISKMPLLILMILNLTYPDYLSALYTTSGGRILMFSAVISLEIGTILFDRARLNQLKMKGVMGS